MISGFVTQAQFNATVHEINLKVNSYGADTLDAVQLHHQIYWQGYELNEVYVFKDNVLRIQMNSRQLMVQQDSIAEDLE